MAVLNKAQIVDEVKVGLELFLNEVRLEFIQVRETEDQEEI